MLSRRGPYQMPYKIGEMSKFYVIIEKELLIVSKKEMHLIIKVLGLFYRYAYMSLTDVI